MSTRLIILGRKEERNSYVEAALVTTGDSTMDTTRCVKSELILDVHNKFLRCSHVLRWNILHIFSLVKAPIGNLTWRGFAPVPMIYMKGGRSY